MTISGIPLKLVRPTATAAITFTAPWAVSAHVGNCTLDSQGMVTLVLGALYQSTTTPPAGTTVTTIPLGYRPTARLLLTSIEGSHVSRIDIATDGTVTCVFESNPGPSGGFYFSACEISTRYKAA